MLFGALLFGLTSCEKRPEQDFFIVPKGHSGWCVVGSINGENAPAPRFVRGRKVYIVPKGGILVAGEILGHDWHRDSFAYYSSHEEIASKWPELERFEKVVGGGGFVGAKLVDGKDFNYFCFWIKERPEFYPEALINEAAALARSRVTPSTKN